MLRDSRFSKHLPPLRSMDFQVAYPNRPTSNLASEQKPNNRQNLDLFLLILGKKTLPAFLPDERKTCAVGISEIDMAIYGTCLPSSFCSLYPFFLQHRPDVLEGVSPRKGFRGSTDFLVKSICLERLVKQS